MSRRLRSTCSRATSLVSRAVAAVPPILFRLWRLMKVAMIQKMILKKAKKSRPFVRSNSRELHDALLWHFMTSYLSAFFLNQSMTFEILYALLATRFCLGRQSGLDIKFWTLCT